MTEEDFALWLATAAAGDTIVYATASNLANRKEVSRPTRSLCHVILAAYGRGEVELTQRKIRKPNQFGAGALYQYLATKRRNIRPPVPFVLPKLGPDEPELEPELEVAA